LRLAFPIDKQLIWLILLQVPLFYLLFGI